jgi:hypothetical protein
MSLMFFLAGVFTWPSLTRWGARQFLQKRLLRLAAPFLFGVIVVMPAALYPAFRVTAVDPGLAEYVREYAGLPFLPNGPMWFLWILVVLTLFGAGLKSFAGGAVERIGALSETFDERPKAAFALWTLVAALAYAPFAIAFTPWQWVDHGLLAFQFSRPLLYSVYYGLGLGIGALGLGRGMLKVGGTLSRRWRVWASVACGSLLAWMCLTALTLSGFDSWPFKAASAVSYAFAGAAGVAFALAFALRFGLRRWRVIGSLSDNALGIYLCHYAFVVWLQYALLGADLPGIVKAGLVFLAATLLSWGAAVGVRALGRLLPAWLYPTPLPQPKRFSAGS